MMVTMEAAWQEFLQWMTMALGGYIILMGILLGAAALFVYCHRKSAAPKQAALTVNPLSPMERKNLVASRIRGGY